MAEKMYEVGIGVVGCGSVAEIAAVCDVKEDVARKVAEKWKSKVYYIDHTKMVERKDLDTVIIATPTFLSL